MLGASDIREATGGGIVAQQQADLGRPARQHRIRRKWRQAFDQRPGAVQVAHGDQPLDAQGQQLAGLAAADRRAAHEQALRKPAQRRHPRGHGQIR